MEKELINFLDKINEDNIKQINVALMQHDKRLANPRDMLLTFRRLLLEYSSAIDNYRFFNKLEGLDEN